MTVLSNHRTYRGDRSSALLGTILLLIALTGFPATAHCQEAVTEAQPETEPALDTIIVTARRRPEDVQSTPVSVIALTDRDLDDHAITNLRDLQGLVPNLTLAPQQNVGEGSGNIFIRGIGQEDFIAGAEPGVALYIDGVYVSTTRGTIFDLSDIERIEVLRGPQGTLFGKNSIGGAIQIISKSPQPFSEARARLTIGSFDRAELRLMANQPISDRLMTRLSFAAVRADGYMRRLPPPQRSAFETDLDLRNEGLERNIAGRLQLRWLASPTSTIDLAFDGTRKRNTQSPHLLEESNFLSGSYPTYNRLIELGRLPGPALTNANLPHGFYESYAAGANRSDIDGFGMSLVWVRELGFGEAQLTMSHRGLDSHFANDNDGLYFDIASTDFDDKHRQSTGELQLTGTVRGVDFSAGIFMLWERTRSFPTSGLRSNGTLYLCDCFYPEGGRPVLLTPERDLRGQSHAAYGQVTVPIVARLSATLGARYTVERKEARSASILVDADTLAPTGIRTATGKAKEDWEAFTYRAGLEWQATPDVMAYASVSKGFKGGGFNVRVVPDVPNLGLTSYDPETARTFELGIRSEWLDNRLRINATAFSGRYRDLQLRQQKIIAGVVTSQVDNAALARIRGLEVEAEAQPIRDLRLKAAYGFLDPEYLDTVGVPDIDLDSRLQRAPRHSLAASFTYTVPIWGGPLEVGAAYTYRAKEQFQVTSSPFDQDAYGLFSARLRWAPADSRWSFGLFGKNLWAEEYRVAGRGTTSIVGRPRHFGLVIERGLFGNSPR